MHKTSLRSTLGLALVLCLPFTAAHAASAEKVDELMQVMDVEANLVQMQAMMVRMVDDSFRAQALKKGLTPAQMERTAAAQQAMKSAFAKMFTWEQLGPRYRAIYQEVLTDAEVDGALAYYRTPAGASMKAKTPLLMERSMQVGQQLAMENFPKMQADLDKAMAEAVAADKE